MAARGATVPAIGAPPLSRLSLFRIVPRRNRPTATFAEIAIEADRVLQRRRAVVHVACNRDHPVLGLSRVQVLQQAVQFVGIVVGVEIAFMALYSPAVADSTAHGANAQPPRDLQPDPEWRLLHATPSSTPDSIGTGRQRNVRFRVIPVRLPSSPRPLLRRALVSDFPRIPPLPTSGTALVCISRLSNRAGRSPPHLCLRALDGAKVLELTYKPRQTATDGVIL